MITIRNMTRGGIGITPAAIVPAGGTLNITPDEFKKAITTAPFQARLNSGDLIATQHFDVPSHLPDQPDPVEPPMQTEFARPEREILTDRAAELGIKVTKRTQLKTIRRKIAEAEGEG